jgi:hypothetical protein
LLRTRELGLGLRRLLLRLWRPRMRVRRGRRRARVGSGEPKRSPTKRERRRERCRRKPSHVRETKALFFVVVFLLPFACINPQNIRNAKSYCNKVFFCIPCGLVLSFVRFSRLLCSPMLYVLLLSLSWIKLSIPYCSRVFLCLISVVSFYSTIARSGRAW